MNVQRGAAAPVWVRVTQAAPCPVCGHPKWCSVSEDGRWAFCMHERSDHPAKDGEGWMHKIGTDGPAPAVKLKARPAAAPAGRGISVRSTYELRDPAGVVVAYHCRRDFADGSKNLWWQNPEGKAKLGGKSADLPLYGCEHLGALEPDTPVVVVEGEKAQEALRQIGIAAVGTVTGADVTPSAESLRVLLGHPVLLWPDNDEKGRAHMAAIGKRLRVLGAESRVVTWAEAPEKGDAADLAESGGKEAVEAVLGAVQDDPPAFVPSSGKIDAFDEKGGAEGILSSPASLLGKNGSGPVFGTPGQSWSTPGGLSVGVTLLSLVQSERVRWLWPGRIPLGKITVVDGDPGLGKTTAILDVGSRLTTHRAMPDGARGDLDGPRGVIIMTAEDGLGDTIRPRLEAAGADLARVLSFDLTRDGDGNERMPSILHDLDALEAIIRQLDAALVIVDPLMAYLGDAKEANANHDQDVRRVLSPFGRMLERVGCAAAVIRHLRKAESGNAIYRGGGSIGIIGAARSGLIVATDPDDKSGARRIMAVSKANLAAPASALAYRTEGMPNGSVRIAWEGPTHHTAIGLLGTIVSVEERDQLNEAEDFLRQMLWTEQGAQAKDVQREARTQGYSDKILRRARERLGVVSNRVGPFGSGGVWMWSLPPRYRDLAQQTSERAKDAPRTPFLVKGVDLANVDNKGAAPTSAPPAPTLNVVEL